MGQMLDQREHEREHMLDDIREELRYTRDYIHRHAFSREVMAAMAAVPRHLFVPEEMQAFAYHNGPLPIGHGQTISQPYIVALMSHLLQVGKEATVLEVGTGSGYQTAILSQLVKQVYTIEIVEPLGESACPRLHALGYGNIDCRIGDGYQGWIEHAPYDGIIVTAAAPHVPLPLQEQLRPGAKLVIPLDNGFMGQELTVVEKRHDGSVRRESVLPVAFVPLTRAVAVGTPLHS